MAETPDPSSFDLESWLHTVLTEPVTVLNYVQWRERLGSLTDSQGHDLLKRWQGEVKNQAGVQSDQRLNWAIPFLDQGVLDSVQQHLLRLLGAEPETVRYEFWMTALAVCDCWAAIAAQHSEKLTPLILPLLRKAVQKPDLAEPWWTHWVAGIRALIAVNPGDVSSWALKVQEILAAGHPPALVTNSPLLADLNKAIRLRSESGVPAKRPKAAGSKKGTAKKSITSKSTSTPVGLPDTNVWTRLRVVIAEAEAASFKEQSAQEALNDRIRELTRERDALRQEVGTASRNYEELRIQYAALTREQEKSLADVSRLGTDLAHELRHNREIQEDYRKLVDLYQKTKTELAEWQRTAEMREHEVKNQRNTLSLEFRDRVRSGPVRLATFVKDYLEALLADDRNPELIPLLGHSFDELHRSLLGMADMPQDARIRRELLSRPEGS